MMNGLEIFHFIEFKGHRLFSFFLSTINAEIDLETHSVSKLLRGYHGRAGDQVQANFGIDISYQKESLNIQCHCDTSIRASVITNILNQR